MLSFDQYINFERIILYTCVHFQESSCLVIGGRNVVYIQFESGGL